MYNETKYLPVGDRGLMIEFGDCIAPDINKKVRSFALALEKEDVPGIVEYIPTYRSLLVLFDPLVWETDSLAKRLRVLEKDLTHITLPDPCIFYLPVAYGGEFGPDLPNVCRHSGLSDEEVVAIHTGVDYLIYMIGFTPGFPYLGGMDERISAPRHETPRISLSAGSVGIAGKQTGIYPVVSPGGWQIIGRTPVQLFNQYRGKPVLLNPGDYVRFFTITAEEYRRIKKEAENGEYLVKVCPFAGKEG